MRGERSAPEAVTGSSHHEASHRAPARYRQARETEGRRHLRPLAPDGAAPLAERDLWRIWEEQRLPLNLQTRDGRALRVLFPGIPNTDAGPDFAGAFLVLDNAAPRRGDVELHVDALSWERHGHHHDPRYDRVILHVVLLDDGGPAHTSSGKPIPLLAIGPLLAGAAENDREPAWKPLCRDAGSSRGASSAVKEALNRAGIERFQQRVALWQAAFQCRPVEDCVLLALLRGAGMGKNAAPAAALAERLDGVTLDALLAANPQRSPAIAEAVLLGMAGLLECAHAGADARDIWQTYRECWPGRPLSSGAWRRFRVRPANLPEARLRQVAAVASRAGLRQFLVEAASLVDIDPLTSCARWTAFLGDAGRAAGRSWTLEFLSSLLLPLLAACALDQSDARLAARTARAFAELPGGGQNAVLDRMVRIAGLRAPPRAAAEQQGLLHVWNTHCSRQLCDGCPLAAAG